MRFAIHRQGNPVASSRSHDVPRRDVLGRVHISVDHQATGAAPESRLALSRFRVAVPAARAGLRRVRGIDPLDPAGCFVLQAAYQQSPSGSQDAPIQPGLCANVSARRLHATARGATHIDDLEVLDTDHVEPARQVCTGLLDPILSPVRLASLQLGNGNLYLAATVRAGFGAGEFPLQQQQSVPLTSGQPRHGQQISRRQSRRYRDTPIDPDDFAIAWCGNRAGRRCKGNVPPSRTVTRNAVGHHARRHRARPTESYPPDLRNPYLTDLAGYAFQLPLPAAAYNPESFVPASLAPCGLACWVVRVEEGDHRLGEIPQGLLLHCLRSRTKPCVLRSRLRELSALLYVTRSARAAWAPVRVLFDGQIPYKSGVVTVIPQQCLLIGRWDQSVTGHANTLTTTTDIYGEVTRRAVLSPNARSFTTRSI